MIYYFFNSHNKLFTLIQNYYITKINLRIFTSLLKNNPLFFTKFPQYIYNYNLYYLII